ncbi:DoxX family protein [Halotalea alkalilenta]|nr:DoxX family protein [Halotalea alkalilenta]
MMLESTRPTGADAALLLARLLAGLLFLIFGVMKVSGFSATVAGMSAGGVPLPMLAAIIAVVIELPLAILLMLGFATRPLALVFAVYTVATAVLGHPYWAVPADQWLNMLTHFYKNLAIAGGFLALYVAGPGRFSLDARRG